MIRAIAKEDFDQWLSLWGSYNKFYSREVASEVTRESFRRFQDGKEPIHALVAEENGKIVGMVHYLFHRHSASLTDVCYLQDLFTLESERGKGIARALVEEVSRQAKKAGSDRVYWMTHENNLTARRLYDKIARNTGFLIYQIQS